MLPPRSFFLFAACTLLAATTATAGVAMVPSTTAAAADSATAPASTSSLSQHERNVAQLSEAEARWRQGAWGAYVYYHVSVASDHDDTSGGASHGGARKVVVVGGQVVRVEPLFAGESIHSFRTIPECFADIRNWLNVPTATVTAVYNPEWGLGYPLTYTVSDPSIASGQTTTVISGFRNLRSEDMQQQQPTTTTTTTYPTRTPTLDTNSHWTVTLGDVRPILIGLVAGVGFIVVSVAVIARVYRRRRAALLMRRHVILVSDCGQGMALVGSDSLAGRV